MELEGRRVKKGHINNGLFHEIPLEKYFPENRACSMLKVQRETHTYRHTRSQTEAAVRKISTSGWGSVGLFRVC